jgi:hypothetical protein
MTRQIESPSGSDPWNVIGTIPREVVTISVVIQSGRLGGERLRLCHAVYVQHARAKVDAITGDTNHSFHHDHLLAIGLKDRFVKDDGLAPADRLIRQYVGPASRRRPALAINNDVIAYKECARHGA